MLQMFPNDAESETYIVESETIFGIPESIQVAMVPQNLFRQRSQHVILPKSPQEIVQAEESFEWCPLNVREPRFGWWTSSAICRIGM
jgi:hypothetical protein